MIDIKVDMKKCYIQTWGCQMNVYDTELVKAILTKAEYELVPKEDSADIVMLNTCAIREHAHRKVYGRVHDIRHKRNGKPVMIGILGCMATNLRTDLLENKNLNIDFIAGPDSYKRLPALIAEASGDRSKAFDVTLSEFETYSDVFPKPEAGVNAFISVQRGCNNFCTFCVVPYTRGRERSRSVENVVKEARRLAADGFKQITLLGQNVNSYFCPFPEETAKTPNALVSTKGRNQSGVTVGHDFADLMQAVSQVEGIERIRFTSPHPKDFPDKFLKAMTDNPKICKQIHLPLQAGSTRVLDAMNRTYTKEEFLSLAKKIRRTIPGVALSTDVIVGFPTETDKEFEETLEVMRAVQFDSAFMFKYSERQGTIAQRKLPDDVPEAIKTERIVALNELQREIAYSKNKEHIGKTYTVLVEKIGTDKDPALSLGRLDNNKLVIFPTAGSKQGQFVEVQITEATPFNLKGTISSFNPLKSPCVKT